MFKTIILALFLVILIFISPKNTFAKEIHCANSMKNNLWIGVPFREDVINLQIYLNKKGFKVPMTGFYGLLTEKSVKDFQSSIVMEVTGQVGFMTRIAINQEICNNYITDFNPKKNVSAPDKNNFKELVYLSIPLIEQRYRLSCEAASMQMAMLYKGIIKNQDELLSQIGISLPFKKYFKNKELIWGDPDLGFVGDVRGYVYKYNNGYYDATGWGVNNGPVARVLKLFLPLSVEIDNATVDIIKDELRKNNPIIFWHKDDDSIDKKITYKTISNKNIIFTATHVALITGFYIDKEDKVFYFINDPMAGRLVVEEEKLQRIMTRWNNDIVVVR